MPQGGHCRASVAGYSLATVPGPLDCGQVGGDIVFGNFQLLNAANALSLFVISPSSLADLASAGVRRRGFNAY